MDLDTFELMVKSRDVVLNSYIGSYGEQSMFNRIGNAGAYNPSDEQCIYVERHMDSIKKHLRGKIE